MNGIERITARIEADGRAEAEAILEKGRAEAAAIEEEYRRRAEIEGAALTAQAEKKAREREERLVSAAAMESRKILLAARQEMVEKAFAQALDRLCSLPREEYVEVLAALLERCATGGEEVIFSRADRERVGEETLKKAAGKQLRLAEETRPLRGGFILRKGKVEVNCAFETLVRLQKGQCAAQAAKLLFPEL